MMKKRLPTFLAGVLTATLVFGLGLSALAATGAVGTVDYNTVGLIKDSQQVFYAGEDYTLSNGYTAPASILFTDPSGNGTTYLPVRRIADLFNAQIGWDNATGSVVIGEGLPAVSAPPAASPSPQPSETAAPVGKTVYVTATGEKYHNAGCRYLKKSQRAITLSDAQSRGYSACSVCKP